MKIFLLRSFILCLSLSPANAQQYFQTGLLPQVNINAEVSQNWKLSFKLEARQILKEGDFETPCPSHFVYERTDLGVMLCRKLGKGSALGAGYLIRLDGPDFFHRFSQQYCLKSKDNTIRTAHRFLADQTISAVKEASFRLRYRISMELPLLKPENDAKELYLKLTNEYLGIVDISKLSAEIRAGLMLGYAFSEKHRLEWGLDYRLKDFVARETMHQFWFYLGYTASL